MRFGLDRVQCLVMPQQLKITRIIGPKYLHPTTHTMMAKTCNMDVDGTVVVTSLLGGVQSIVTSMSVCLSVRSHRSKTTRPNFACGRGSVLL